MDFVDGLVAATSSSSSFLDAEAKQRVYGSGIFKTDRSSVSDDEWRSSKLAKTDDFSLSNAMQRGVVLPSMIRSNNLSSSNSSSSSSFFSAAARQEQQQMLCFSSPKTESALPYYNYPVSAAAACSNYSGFNLGSLNLQGGGSCRGGGFTPSQWMELEQQALIYKYINANIPVPSNLLIPIKKAFESAGFSFYHGGSIMRPNNNSLGWSGFHLGFSGSSDPEPGRCRRTDGKKWRCSKDAMPDQKYCERHMNRGRHRSRKPVEGQSAHPLSGTTAAAAKESSTTLLPPAASSVSVAAAGGAAYNTSAAYQMQPGVLSLSADNTLNRFLVTKDNSTEKPLNPTATTFSNDDLIKSKDNHPFLLMKYDSNESSRVGSRFGSDTLFGNLGTLKELTDTETSPHHHHRFMNSDWPPPQSHVSNIQSDSTHLSISMTSHSDHSILPLNLGMGAISSVGGPLGEVLQNANSSSSSSTAECRNSSGLNLMMMDGWDRSSPAGSYSSPTAVLQKSSAFESVSNSSAGSSPRAA